MERIDFLLAANAAGNDELARGEPAETRGHIERETLQHAFAIDVRVKEGGDEGIERGNGIVRRESDLGLPALDGDAAIFGIDAGNDALGADGRGKFGGEGDVDRSLRGEESGTEDDALRASGKNFARTRDRVNAAACPCRRCAICATSAELSPWRMAASRSMSCTSGKRANFSIQ